MYCSKCGNFEQAGVTNCSKCNNAMLMKTAISSPPLPATTTSNDETSSSGHKIIALAITVRVITTFFTLIAAGASLFGVRSYGLAYALAGCFVILFVGLFYSWAFSILIRGFGELVNNSEKIANKK